MARDQRERSVRRDPALNVEDRPVRLETSRRFFTAQGNRGPMDKARALQNALGFGVETYVDVLEQRNEEGAQRALGQAASGQEKDADDKNKGYEETWQKIEASQDIAQFRRELSKMMVDEDWDQLSHEEVQGKIDEYFQGQLAGINMESAYGQAIAPAILQQNAALLETHANAFAARELEEYRGMAFKSFMDDMEVNGEPNFDMLAEFAANLPSEEKKLFYWESISDAAEELRDLSIFDKVPERLPNQDLTGINDPEFIDKVINPAKARVQALIDADKEAYEEAYKTQYQGQRAAAHSELTRRAKEGDPSVIQDIFSNGIDGPDGQPKLLTRPQQKTLFDQYNAAREQEGVDGMSANLYGAGQAYGMTANEYDNAASQYASRLTEQLQAQNPDMSDDDIQDTVRKAVLERAYVHDRLPKFITDFITVTPSSPERFKKAFDMKLEIDAYDPTLVQRSIPDRNAAMLDAYALNIADMKDPDGALEALGTYDHTLARGMQKEIDSAVDTALTNLANDMPGWGDYPITGRDRKRAQQLATHYANLGYDEERISRFVENGMRGRNTRVNGQLYPIDAGWVKGDEAAEFYLNDISREFNADPESMEMLPHPSLPGHVVIRDKDQILPMSTPAVPIAEIERLYAERQQEQLFEDTVAHRQSNSALYQEAEARAFDRMYPENVWLEPGARAGLRKDQQERWKNMDPATRRRLIEAEMTN